MPKRILTGTVVSSSGNKTIIVKVIRRVKHNLYKKIINSNEFVFLDIIYWLYSLVN